MLANGYKWEQKMAAVKEMLECPSLPKRFPLDSRTTYCILLLYQIWFLSKHVTVFPKLLTLMRLGIFNKVFPWQFHVKILIGFVLVGKILCPLPELAYYNVASKGLNNIRV